MADGSLTLTLDEALSKRIEAAAAAAGMSPQDYAAQLLEQHVFDYDDYEWDEDPRLTPAAEVAEATFPRDEVMAEFRAELERRLAESQ